ncbi:T9SS type A sorting domain-containing protein [Dyadobacter luticola]|uniref:T9SS type A sorting domain-containing protein n=1 Tax=Dyadobacter luticola TaxID=1979387 RepID=A0A5R9L0Q9_9BACT|nr:T9SS type A sorting domain-containing protein [Dyadobacter luticola]TLV02122.1 T9SS type A sorting domain-containing protein [Dyadobacter luticola]
MKTKKLLLSLLTFCASAASYNSFSQDVSLNVTPLQASILNYTTGELEVTLCNEDPSDIAAPANKLRPLISFPDNLTLLDVTNADGSPLTNFQLQKMTNIEGDHSVRVLYQVPLPNAQCISFHIKFQGNAVGTGPITASLGFVGPQTTGNNPANDNSTATTPVEVNLPVTLASFEAKAEGKTAQLQWVTSDEVNSDHFDVQRSRNGKDWQTFQSVQALGESKEKHDYSAVDEHPFSGENFYRLHMIDQDGSNTYSSIRHVFFKSSEGKIYPNPVSDYFVIENSDWNEIKTVAILNSSGVAVYKSPEIPEKTVNTKNLPAGTYIVSLNYKNGDSKSHKIIITH